MKSSNLLSVLLVSAFVATSARAADYTIDQSHSSVGFSIRHLVGKVKGDFKDFEGTFSFDPAKPEATTGKITIKAASINTGNAKRDGHLRDKDFFEVKKYPTITYTNIKMTADGENKYKMTGDLTMHGETQPQSFDVVFNGTAKDPWGANRAGFTATGKLNRKDYKIVYNQKLDTGGLMLGEEVDVELQIEAIEGKPAEAAPAKKKTDKGESKAVKKE